MLAKIAKSDDHNIDPWSDTSINVLPSRNHVAAGKVTFPPQTRFPPNPKLLLSPVFSVEYKRYIFFFQKMLFKKISCLFVLFLAIQNLPTGCSMSTKAQKLFSSSGNLVEDGDKKNQW
jgi:hypothetical protein